MRKWLTGLIVLLLLIVAGAYLLLPKQLVVAKVTMVGAGQNSVYRCLSDAGCIQRWWYDSTDHKVAFDNSPLQKGNQRFQFVPRFGNVVTASISNGDSEIQSSIAVLALGADSAAVEWKATLPPTDNILKRVQQYFFARTLQHTMAEQMERFQAFMANDNIVYNLDVQPARVVDTFVVTASMMTDGYPAPADYYPLVQKLKSFIAAQGAQETNYPMLNISPVDNRYQARVAIPVSKVLPSAGEIAFKRLIPGNILIAEIRGGPHAINQGLQNLEYFVAEKGFRSPAIPFQSLVTDRLQEADTAKWITRLYYPVY